MTTQTARKLLIAGVAIAAFGFTAACKPAASTTADSTAAASDTATAASDAAMAPASDAAMAAPANQ